MRATAREFRLQLELERRFNELTAELERAGEEPTEERLDDLKAEFCRVVAAHGVEAALREKVKVATEERPGVPFVLDGGLELGGDILTPKRHATLERFKRAIEHWERNKAAPTHRLRRELELLRPYWTDGISMQEAVERYERANPGTGGVE